MNIRLVVIVILAASLAAGASAAADEYIMVVQWPPTFCFFEQCKPRLVPPPRFLLHGLWPKDRPLNRPCFGEDFDEHALLVVPALETELRRDWPTLKEWDPEKDEEDTDEKFWGRQWRKHGRCAEPPMRLTEYFSKTVALFRAERFAIDLKNAGIVFDKPYTPQDFRARMQSVRHKPAAYCVRGKKTTDYLLHELRYCVNEAGTQILNCPRAVVGDSCPYGKKDTITIYKSI